MVSSGSWEAIGDRQCDLTFSAAISAAQQDVERGGVSRKTSQETVTVDQAQGDGGRACGSELGGRGLMPHPSGVCYSGDGLWGPQVSLGLSEGRASGAMA